MLTSFAGPLLLVARLAAALPPGEEPLVPTYLTGVVRDADRKPVAKAVVRLRGTFGYQGPWTGPSDRGVADAAGKYRLGFVTKPGGVVEVLGVSAEAEGFVRLEAGFGTARPVLKPGGETELNLVMARGELLAGAVEVPGRLRDRLAWLQHVPETYAVRVRGQGFSQVHLTQPGGAFMFWVPAGAYDLELLRASDEAPEAALKGVHGGAHDLRLVKVDPPVDTDVLTRAFDALWGDMDRNYSYFALKGVDWSALKKKYRPKAVAARTLGQFVDVLGVMLGELNDEHVGFDAPADAVVARQPPAPRVDANPQAVEAALRDTVRVGNGFVVGTTGPEGFGVVRVVRQSRAREEDVAQVVEFIRSHAGAPGFIVDLRGADGGDEALAGRVAREFCAAGAVYARSKYRNGPQPTDFGPAQARVLGASDAPYTKPVVCILGPGCVSGGEAFAEMMTCLPHVTTVGLPTRGSSGNPKPFELPGVGVTVTYSRSVDMTPDGTPVEGRGIPTQMTVNLPLSDYGQSDPTWEKAVGVLRSKIGAGG